MYYKASHAFLEHLRVVKNASEHTLRNYAIDVNALKTFLETTCSFSAQNSPLNSIDRKQMRLFINWMHKEGSSKRSMARRLSSLRTFFKHCIREGLIQKSPLDDVESPKLDKNLPISLNYEQVLTLFRQPDCTTYLGFRDRTIMELFYSSGLRVSELARLDREDFDQKSLLLLIRGKGKKERMVPITKNAADWIFSYLTNPERLAQTNEHDIEKDSAAIFLNKWGTRLTTRSIDRLFAKYLKQSGLAEDITPHTIRHTIATHWLENGMDLKTIQLLLGHSTMATTTIYTRVSTKLKKDIVRNLHPRG